MKIQEKQAEILKIIENKQRVAISELSRITGIPEVTVRRNVRELDKEGKINREHGFAVYQPEVILPRHFLDFESAPEYVNEIATTVINKLIKEKTAIWLGDGKISYEIARLAKNVSIVTNSLKIAVIAGTAKDNNVKVTLLGEYLEKDSLILSGSSLFKCLEEQNIQTVIVETDGFDTINVTVKAYKADIFQKIMEIGKRESVALLAPSLFGDNSEKIAGRISNFNYVVSTYDIYDYIPSREEREEFKSLFLHRKGALVRAPSKKVIPFSKSFDS